MLLAPNASLLLPAMWSSCPRKAVLALGPVLGSSWRRCRGNSDRESPRQRCPGTVVAVTHDRYFLDNVASWILELDRGRGLPYEGNYSTWLEAKEKRLEQEASTDEARQRTIKSELARI